MFFHWWKVQWVVRIVKLFFYYEDFSHCSSLGILKYVQASHKVFLIHAVVTISGWILGLSVINIKNLKARNKEQILGSLTLFNPLPWESSNVEIPQDSVTFPLPGMFLFLWCIISCLTPLIFIFTHAPELRGRLPTLLSNSLRHLLDYRNKEN